MTTRPRAILPALALAAALAAAAPQSWAAPPGISKLGEQKVLTLVVRDPPWVRCNNNMQVASELGNVYLLPVQVVPQALAGPGARAPAVYWGDELIAEDGGKGNGMVSSTSRACRGTSSPGGCWPRNPSRRTRR
jgi:hypothetical protein